MSNFAEAQLAKFGWEKGKGLGRNNEGIKRAISVVKKNDTKGLGTKEQFDFAWWDHVYNKTSNSIKIEKSTEGISVKKEGGEAQRNRMGIISTERPSAASSVENSDAESGISTPTPKAKSLLYGLFVKSGNSIQNNTEVITKVSTEETKDYSMKISDKELFEACGGRTARKGARGDQSGKLSRIDTDLLLEDADNEKEAKKKRKSEKDTDETGKKSKKSKKEKKEKKSKEDKKEKKEKKSKEDKKEKKEKKAKKAKTDDSNKPEKKEKKSKA
ncbi:hypothetical protein K493DRAFT_338608 [Basidiobolus meristosporus CBS 931.73]|uniref:G-patch domain-containing protein n=1 Tax=Basidiobolus meristosporus CBS 931.73 TaxID=1314790 RepID=A0A1Y1Y487_9FUNG|nr:hypothetical protein K493DRAFT_338608 [Basidiobolus meristosporus CBS 931.73]|eukprot:ORX92842.1 hypothetical protein K493DRAFT_338608 [Basidiobolus meristosporus CBS 931.73]